MKLVILESPFAGRGDTAEAILADREANIAYARACVRDSLLRGESPIASHLLYTQPGILDDDVPAERKHGIDAGLAWRMVSKASVVYVDRGLSQGMVYGILAVGSGFDKGADVSIVVRSLEKGAVAKKRVKDAGARIAGARIAELLTEKGWTQ